MQILVVEDEQRMAELLRRTLQEEGHQVIMAADGKEGFEIARSSPFDVIMLDVMLPGMDGVTVARQLRERRNQTPVLMLTARDAPSDIIKGLDCGADDYLTKPFSIEILLARVRAVSRRGAVARPVCLEVSDVKLDPASRRVTRAGEVLGSDSSRIQAPGIADAKSGPCDQPRQHSRIGVGIRQRRERKHLGSLRAPASA